MVRKPLRCASVMSSPSPKRLHFASVVEGAASWRASCDLCLDRSQKVRRKRQIQMSAIDRGVGGTQTPASIMTRHRESCGLTECRIYGRWRLPKIACGPQSCLCRRGIITRCLTESSIDTSEQGLVLPCLSWCASCCTIWLRYSTLKPSQRASGSSADPGQVEDHGYDNNPRLCPP